MSLLLEHKLVAKKSKCIFGRVQVQFLGHVIAANGVHPDADKVDMISQFTLAGTHNSEDAVWVSRAHRLLPQVHQRLCRNHITNDRSVED